MSSDSRSALELLFLNDYASIVVATAVVYDYILTFPEEVEYVWERPWTFVSTVFVLIRYIGLCWIMTSALVCTSFIPGPLEVSRVVFLISFWTFAVFLSAADLVMILRVWAMWNRSRTILSALISLYMVQLFTTVLYTIIFNSYEAHFSAPRFALGGALVTLAVVQTLRQSVLMYKTTNQWQLNRYMKRLVEDGILYFSVNMLYQTACVLNRGGTPPPNTFFLVLNVGIYVLFYPLVPRFIISVRVLYDHDRYAHDHEGIDTGFGVLSRPGDEEGEESDSDDGCAGGGRRGGLSAITVMSVGFVDDGTGRQSSMVHGCDVDDGDVSSFEEAAEDLGQV